MDDEERARTDLAVMSVEEFKQKRRLERILDARDHVPDTAREATRQYWLGEISAEARNILLLNAVQEYISEIHNLLTDYHEAVRQHNEEVDSDASREYDEYWRPGQAIQADIREPLGRIGLESEDDIWFLGLEDVLWAEDVYVDEWTETGRNLYGQPQEETYRDRFTVPMEVSQAAFIRANEFLDREWDLDLVFEDDTQVKAGWEFNEAALEATERAREATMEVKANGDGED